jgi:sulfite exporter TauE/SafE
MPGDLYYMINICFSLFITGILMGSGPCLLSCGPILLSYIAGTKSSAIGGLRCWFLFSFSKLLSAILLGFIASLAGVSLLRRFYWEAPGYIIWLLTGSFIIFLGVMVFAGAHTKFRLCSRLNQTMIQRDTKSLVILGLLIGALPCVPLLGILSYIAMISTHYWHGIAMGGAFGFGTIISPLIFGSMIAGAITGLKIFQNSKAAIIFQRICGFILIFLGAHIVQKTLMEYMLAR